MAQYVAIAASVMSILGPVLKKGESGTSSGAVSSSSSRGLAGAGSFSSGIVVGLGLGAVLLSQFQRRRIMQRLRFTFLAWQEGLDSNQSSALTRDGNSDKIEPVDLGESAMMQVIANCNNSKTSNLHYSKLTLKKGTRVGGFEGQKSKGVEVYYVLVGKATFILEDIEECHTGVNEYIIVNPWTIRCIENRGSSDLVFLRVSDVGESSNDADLVAGKLLHQNAVQTMANGIKTSIRKISNMTTIGSKDDEC